MVVGMHKAQAQTKEAELPKAEPPALKQPVQRLGLTRFGNPLA